MTYAITVRTPKIQNGDTHLIQFPCRFALFGFISLSVKNSYNFCMPIAEQVVNVPEFLLRFPKMPLYTFLQIALGRPDISVNPSLKMYAIQSANIHFSFLLNRNNQKINAFQRVHLSGPG
jgi:hypothetical protein